ncbi:hypothetical protein [Pseudomonas sp. EL_65y_Pfl2_R96]|uniref:hypothetical protein n=1 Tax=Pseudomonas sp. EL_65y_Pfl2_R96 TaxID=3088699 RepID=UPI0030DC9BDD
MFVLSRVVVGLARQKKELKRGNAFFVLIIPYWTFMYFPSIKRTGLGLADGRVVSQGVIG